MIELNSVITCRNCGHEAEETMPTDACQYFFDCPNCASVLKPKAGDCCVFCSYGTVPCPPVQAACDKGDDVDGQETMKAQRGSVYRA